MADEVYLLWQMKYIFFKFRKFNQGAYASVQGTPRGGNMRSRHAPKGQRAHSPGHRPGYDEAMKCALKGQKRSFTTLVF